MKIFQHRRRGIALVRVVTFENDEREQMTYGDTDIIGEAADGFVGKPACCLRVDPAASYVTCRMQPLRSGFWGGLFRFAQQLTQLSWMGTA